MAVIAITSALPSLVLAGTPYQAEATCPVDGQKFKWTSTASYSTFGMELDGKPIGSWTFPLPLPQCPDSKFPVYREFTPEETAVIQALVQTPDYISIREQPSYYVLAFVASRLDHDLTPLNRGWLLLKASWQAVGEPELYRRYANELVPVMDDAISGLAENERSEWWGYQIILANVQRQAGDFASAKARLDALPQSVPTGSGNDFTDRIAMTRRLIEAQDARPASLPRS